MRKQKFLALLLALAMVLSLLPVMAAAEGEEPAQDGVQLDKELVLEEDGTYTITLEAYATGTVSTTVTTMPEDVVLVLDQSGSMAYAFDGSSTSNNQLRRQYAMKQAVSAFIEQVGEKYTEDADHRISIVTFGSSATTLQGWTTADAAGTATLLAAVDALPDSPSGATRVDLGMAQAETLMGSGYNAPDSEARQKVVIVFTDGVPTTSSEFSVDVADDAIASALNLKNSDAVIYTVGIFNGANPEQLYGDSGFRTNSDGTVGSFWEDIAVFSSSAVAVVDVPAGNRFLNFLSNNFVDADEIGLQLSLFDIFFVSYGRATITKNFTRTSSDYYKVADNASSLGDIFVELSETIGSTTVELGSEAVLRDIVADEFTLPEGASSVEVYTSDYLGEDNWAEPVLVWPDVADSGITATVVENDVDVTGFSYKDNFITEASGNEPARGKKLIVVISGIVGLPDAATGGNVNTNAPGSGVYADAEAEEPVASFVSPTVLIANTTYIMDYAKPLYIPSSVLGLADRTHLADSMGKIEEAHRADPLDLVNGYFEVDASGEEEIFIYTPQTMSWNGYDQVFAFGSTNIPDTYEWSSISIMPASNIYYEDDFVTNEDTGVVGIEYGGNWEVVGESDGNEENPDHDGDSSDDSAYGWVDSLSDDDTYSDGTAHWATLGEDGTATATFTFTGTGVDVYSRTNMDAGMILAYIKRSGDAESENTKWVMVDNLSQSGDYYQIPTLSFFDLEHGTYEVGISVRKAKAVDEDGNVIPDETRSTYYLDGIRIYTPQADVDEGVVSDETADKLQASFMSVREMLSETDDNTVFIDSDAEGNPVAGDYNATEYGTYGPKNEVYLEKGQSITFRVTETGVEQFYVGLKSPEGAALAVQVTNGDAKSELKIGHATDLYYQVVPSADGYVSISNAGDGILSVTKLQVVAADAAAAVVALSADEAVSYAAVFASASVVPYEMDAQTPEVSMPEPPARPNLPDLEIVNPIPVKPVIEDILAQIVDKLFSSIRSWF